MALYHFDIADRFPPEVAEAIELESLAVARQHALRYAGHVLADQLPDFWNADEWTLTVSDADHLTLFTVCVMAANAPSTSALQVGHA